MTSMKDSLGFILADVSRLMRREFERRSADGPLTLAQARTLVYVSRHAGVRQVELADRLDIKPITLARLIDQLQASGLVERRPDPTDRRAYRIHTLPRALPHLAAIDKTAAAIRIDALRGLDGQQAQALMDALLTMRANLSGREGVAS